MTHDQKFDAVARNIFEACQADSDYLFGFITSAMENWTTETIENEYAGFCDQDAA